MRQNRKRVGTAIILVSAFIMALVFGYFAAALIHSTMVDSDPPCYVIIGKSGREYPSYYPPEPAEDGGNAIWVFNDDHTWGYVFGPEALRADRDCLRARGVTVPPLKQRDESIGGQQ